MSATHFHKLTILGKVNKPVAQREFNGKPILNISLICEGKPYTTPEGEQKKSTHYFRVTVWNENIIRSLAGVIQEGCNVLVQGTSKLSTYTDQSSGKEYTNIECTVGAFDSVVIVDGSKATTTNNNIHNNFSGDEVPF